MENIQKINIQKIEFINTLGYANVFCAINEEEDKNDYQMIIEQRILNRIICKIQAAQMDDEVLNYMESQKIDDENTAYTINLKETSYENAWIELDEQSMKYQLIRA